MRGWIRAHLRTMLVILVTAAVTATAPAIASTVVNADKVDGFDAVGSAVSKGARAGKLVATNRRTGLLPNNIIAKAPDADRLDGKDSSKFALRTKVFGIVLAGDGPGSGLNADLLDGKSSKAFAPSGQTDLKAYCALVAANPASYPAAPCEPSSFNADDPATNQVGDDDSLAIGTDGLPVISYRDATAEALKVLHCGNPACNGGNRITTVDDSASSVGFDTSIAIGTDGLPVISYMDGIVFALKVAHCNDVACSGGDETLTFVDAPAANHVGSSTSIAIGADGLPVISYEDSTANALKVAHCNDVACTGQDEALTTVDDPADSVGDSTSIAIGADGLPVISYRDSTASALKVAHCNDVACTGLDEAITTVDDPADSVGFDTSIAIGADGLPVISYQDGTAHALRVAHCNDVACSGQDETRTAVDDPAQSVGSDTSIAIAADGLPVISYRDSTAGALKVAHCNDAACTGQDETITTVDDPAGESVGHGTSIAVGVDGVPVISHGATTADALRVTHVPLT